MAIHSSTGNSLVDLTLVIHNLITADRMCPRRPLYTTPLAPGVSLVPVGGCGTLYTVSVVTEHQLRTIQTTENISVVIN